MAAAKVTGLRPIGWMANILRLPTNLSEANSLLNFLVLSAADRLAHGADSGRESAVLLRGTRHVFGFGSAEMFTCGEIYIERIYERVADFVPRAGWTVFDVGANVGIFAMLQARRGARVYAFEPSPPVYRRLQLASRLNGLDYRINTFNYGLGDRPGAATLKTPGGVTAWATLERGNGSPANTGMTVAIDTLDRVFPGLGVDQVDLLKIDVEGLELEVLGGSESVLRVVRRVVLEYHSPALCEAVASTLVSHGFTVVHDTQPNETGAGVLYARRGPPT